MSKNVGIQLPFGWDILIVIIGAASGAIWYYSNFENKVNNIELIIDRYAKNNNINLSNKGGSDDE